MNILKNKWEANEDGIGSVGEFYNCYYYASFYFIIEDYFISDDFSTFAVLFIYVLSNPCDF